MPVRYPSSAPQERQAGEPGLPRRISEQFAVAALLLVGLGLRLFQLNDQSFTMDEVEEVAIAHAHGGLFSIINYANRFPPLYHLLLRGWLTAFPTDGAARVLSTLFGMLSIVVVYRLARRIAGPNAGLWAAAVMAMSPFHIWYSQEARVYALFFLLASTALLTLVRALETDSSADWTLFVMAAAAGLYAHYYFVVFVAVAAALVVCVRRADKFGWHRPASALLALVVVGVPWLLLLWHDLGGNWGASRESAFGMTGFAYTYFSFIAGYTLGPSLRELHSLAPGVAVRLLLPWLFAAGLSVGVLAWSGFVALGRFRWRGFLIVLGFVPVLAVGIASELGPFGYNVRHVVWAFAPVAIWIAAGLTRWKNSLAVVAGGLVLFGLSAIAICNRHFSDRYHNEDAAAIAGFLESSQDQMPLFVSAGYMAAPVEYYLDDTWAVISLPTVRSNDGSLDEALRAISARVNDGGQFWFAYSRPFHGDPEGILLRELTGRFTMEREAMFAGFELYRCRPSV